MSAIASSSISPFPFLPQLDTSILAPLPATEESIADKRTELIEWESLFFSISIEIGEDGDEDFDSTLIAATIAATNPGVLTHLSSYRWKEIKASLTPFSTLEAPTNHVRQVALQLYALSLGNGRFGKIADTLEANIQSYLSLTHPLRMQTHINQASILVTDKVKNTLAEIEQQQKELLKISNHISELVSLFCYIDPGYAEPLEVLLRQAKYPECQKLWRTLQQQLQTRQYERGLLQTLGKEIQHKLSELAEHAKPFLAADKSSELPAAKESFYLKNFELFFDTGIKLLENALRSTLREASVNRHILLPKQLKEAIQRISCQNPNWKSYTLSYLLHHLHQPLEKPFVHALWADFSNDDVEGLMRTYLASLPDSWFEDLQKELKASTEPSKQLESHFLKDLRVKLNFLSLKKWYEANKPQ